MSFPVAHLCALHPSRHPRDEYIRTILSPNSWGGAIELTILATHYGTEIASIDVETGRIDRFGSNGGGPESRALLIYSGIHYDAAVLAPDPDAPQEFCASVVPAVGAEGDRVLEALGALATKLRAKRAYTNTATFDLRCQVRATSRRLCQGTLLLIERMCICFRSAEKGSRGKRRPACTRQRRGM